MPWQKRITKIMLEHQINHAVDEFASAICESLDQLRAQLREALSKIQAAGGGDGAVEHLHAALDYIEGLMLVLKCAPEEKKHN